MKTNEKICEMTFKIILMCMTILFVSNSCNENSKTKDMATLNNQKTDTNIIFPKGKKASNNYFTGNVWVQTLVNSKDIEDLYTVGSVTFEPGGKTNWHTHPIGQVLLVTEGKGYYQEKGKEARSITKGDVVVIPKDIEHWHGASKDTKLIHVAISNMKEGASVTWLSPITDKEYNKL